MAKRKNTGKGATTSNKRQQQNRPPGCGNLLGKTGRARVTNGSKSIEGNRDKAAPKDLFSTAGDTIPTDGEESSVEVDKGTFISCVLFSCVSCCVVAANTQQSC
jgi:hypothetical protein